MNLFSFDEIQRRYVVGSAVEFGPATVEFDGRSAAEANLLSETRGTLIGPPGKPSYRTVKVCRLAVVWARQMSRG
jgi:hypothetical protein